MKHTLTNIVTQYSAADTLRLHQQESAPPTFRISDGSPLSQVSDLGGDAFEDAFDLTMPTSPLRDRPPTFRLDDPASPEEDIPKEPDISRIRADPDDLAEIPITPDVAADVTPVALGFPALCSWVSARSSFSDDADADLPPQPSCAVHQLLLCPSCVQLRSFGPESLTI